MDVDEEHCSGLLEFCICKEELKLPDALFICNKTGPAKVVFVWIIGVPVCCVE